MSHTLMLVALVAICLGLLSSLAEETTAQAFVMEPPWDSGASRTVLTTSPNHTCPEGNRVQDCYALDFAGGGYTVRAAAGGVVRWAGWYDDSSTFSCFGNSVSILHANGIVTFYAHLSSIAPGITSDVAVETGTPLGIAGATGSNHGCGTWNAHLHFGAYTGAQAPTTSPPYAGSARTISFVNCTKSSGGGCSIIEHGDVLLRGSSQPPPSDGAPLGKPNLGAWCQYLGHKGVTTVQPNAYGLRCVTQSNQLVHMSVWDACKHQFNNPEAVDIMRDFNDPQNWLCFDTGEFLGAPNLGAWCQHLGHKGVATVEATAYGLRCVTQSNQLIHMSVLDACRWQFNRQDVIDSMRNFNDPYDWKCWSVN